MKTIDLTTANCDLYGNPRVIVHFSSLLTDKEYNDMSISEGYNLAHKRALKLGGKIYRGNFGGGFVFQCWSNTRLVREINDMLKDK
ncbi:MAG: hypothetical protein ACKOWO_01095 [Sediminibacterium sp.]